MRDHIHFVTGRLAEHALRDVLQKLKPSADFEYSVEVLPITVAALMTPKWIADRIHPPADATRVIVPGYCNGDLGAVAQATGLPIERGPKDLRQLPEFFGKPRLGGDDLSAYDIEIIAEINHAPRLNLAEILDQAARLRADGADLIDVGCDPGGAWTGVADCVKALKHAGASCID